MRAADRYRSFKEQEARHRWLHRIRNAATWVVLVCHFVVGLALTSSLYANDPSTLDEDMAFGAFAIMFLVGLLLIALLMAGAPPAPIASATIPPLVLCSLPWRDIHSAAIPMTCWLGVHAVVLVWCFVRHPGRRGSPAAKSHGHERAVEASA